MDSGFQPVEVLGPKQPRGPMGFISVRSESGQALMMVALMMTLFVFILGLVIDYGYSNVLQRQMQFAADAAALAGARELAIGGTTSTAGQRIEQILLANGADLSHSSYSFDGNQVSVSAGMRQTTFFLSIAGVDEIPIDTQAKALYGQVSRADHLMPFAIEEDLWLPGQTVTLWGDSHGPGNFGWVRWTGQTPSTPVLRANIDNPRNSDILFLGDSVSGHPGVSFNAVQSNLNNKIGQVITLFLYDPSEVTGSGSGLEYQVRGFARFRLTGTYSHGSSSEIYGQFVEYAALGGPINAGSTLGYSGVGLIE